MLRSYQSAAERQKTPLTDKLSLLQVSVARQDKSRNDSIVLKARNNRTSVTKAEISELDTNLQNASGFQDHRIFYDSKKFKS